MSLVNVTPTAPVIPVNTATNSKVILLPIASTIPGKIFTIKDYTGNAPSNPIYVSTIGSDFLDGPTNRITLSNVGEAITVQSTAANKWSIINRSRDVSAMSKATTIVLGGLYASFGIAASGSPNAPSSPTLTLLTGVTAQAAWVLSPGAWTQQSGAKHTVELYSNTQNQNNGGTLVTSIQYAINISSVTYSLSAGYYYYIVVYGTNIKGNSSGSVSSVIVTLPVSPSSASISGNGSASWSTSVGANSYNVSLYSNVSNQTDGATLISTTSYSGTSTTFTLDNGMYYFILVSSVNDVGTSATSRLSSIIATTPLPPEQASLSTTGEGTWSTSRGSTSYTVTLYSNINRQTEGASVVTYGTYSSDSIQFTVENGLYYFITVTASNASGTSSATTSDIVLGVAPPNTPTNITLNAAGEGSWDATPFAISYTATLYYNYEYSTVEVFTNSYTFSVTSGVEYYFTLTASNEQGTSTAGVSNTITAVSGPEAPATATLYDDGTALCESGVNATSYIVTLYVNTVNSTAYASAIVSLVVSDPTHAFTFSNATVGNYYFIGVVSNNNGDSSLETQSSIIEIHPDVPMPETAVLNIDGTASWSSSVEAATYIVKLYQNVVNSRIGAVIQQTDTFAEQLSTTYTLYAGWYYYIDVCAQANNGDRSQSLYSTSVGPIGVIDATLDTNGYAYWNVLVGETEVTYSFDLFQNTVESTEGAVFLSTYNTYIETYLQIYPDPGYYYYIVVRVYNSAGNFSAGARSLIVYI